MKYWKNDEVKCIFSFPLFAYCKYSTICIKISTTSSFKQIFVWPKAIFAPLWPNMKANVFYFVLFRMRDELSTRYKGFCRNRVMFLIFMLIFRQYSFLTMSLIYWTLNVIIRYFIDRFNVSSNVYILSWISFIEHHDKWHVYVLVLFWKIKTV
jgi:hypothetical protein